jgi:hypothetical protein
VDWVDPGVAPVATAAGSNFQGFAEPTTQMPDIHCFNPLKPLDKGSGGCPQLLGNFALLAQIFIFRSQIGPFNFQLFWAKSFL